MSARDVSARKQKSVYLFGDHASVRNGVTVGLLELAHIEGRGWPERISITTVPSHVEQSVGSQKPSKIPPSARLTLSSM